MDKVENIVYDAIIIGSGPAGLTTAIYCARSNLKILMIEKGAPGGKLLNTHKVENYTGFNSISGPDLALRMFEQMQLYPIDFAYEEVKTIKDHNSKIKTVVTNEKSYQAKNIVIATGLVSRPLNIPGANEFENKGLSYCVVCDGPMYRGSNMLLVGGGNSAVEESLFATTISPKVYIMQILDHLTAEKINIDDVEKNPKIEIIYSARITKINGDEKGINSVNYIQDNKEKTLNVSAVFPYIGYIPKTEFSHHLDILDNSKFVKVKEAKEDFETSVDGIFAIGDVVSKNVRQITTATGDGTICAKQIIDRISRRQ